MDFMRYLEPRRLYRVGCGWWGTIPDFNLNLCVFILQDLLDGSKPVWQFIFEIKFSLANGFKKKPNKTISMLFVIERVGLFFEMCLEMN